MATVRKDRYINDALTSQKKSDMFRRLSSLFHVLIGAANDIANTAMLDTIEVIKQTGRYRHTTKKACKEAVRKYEAFERDNFKDMRDPKKQIDKRRLYMDFLDTVSERLSPHVFKFRMSIKQHLDKQGIPDSELKSHVLCADQLLIYSVNLFDDFFDRCPRVPPIDLRRTFLSARLGGTLHAWGIVVNNLCADCTDINFDTDKGCRTAFDVIETNIVSERYVNESGLKALALNPEVKAKLDAD